MVNLEIKELKMDINQFKSGDGKEDLAIKYFYKILFYYIMLIRKFAIKI
jgi:hypothetical protein